MHIGRSACGAVAAVCLRMEHGQTAHFVVHIVMAHGFVGTAPGADQGACTAHTGLLSLSKSDDGSIASH